ncbi:alkaline phosphatase D family protein [Pseudochryseolinea flava]|uniref:Alkaline phosphatase family protein n=1 Tax=Pseudochryseolinea flava TaxID=2059302 RepID=A0A364Y4X8_9BACT|nr:alkaline phosphatase D family protein [Pseudochryseolinea flava]RAW01873.1 alkaline phosphatase family protein [Pseudochryseolinea flava]
MLNINYILQVIRNVMLLAVVVIIGSCSPKETSVTSKTTVTTIAFGSCGDQRRPQPILEQVAEMKPDLFIYLGDNIYSDTEVMDTLRKNYGILGRKPEFQKLKAATPILATWDDHDFGMNDSGRHYKFKEESKQIFMQFFGVMDSTMLEHDGIYFSRLIEEGNHRIQIIFPDMRTFRDKLLPYDDSHKGDARFDYELDYAIYKTADSTMLGEKQWKWIEEQLKVPADLRIIATSTQFGITHNGYEAWANFPHEQKRMIDLIKNTKANGVVFISGDVHYAEISKLTAPGVYPLYDVTASGITSTWEFATPNDNRIDGPVMENHFGVIAVDWKESDPIVHFKIFDVEKKERIHREIRLNDLKF